MRLRPNDCFASAGRVRRWAERLLIVTGLALLFFCGIVLADGFVAQWQARRTLAVNLAAVPAVRVPDRTDVPALSSLARGAALADLSIPRVHLAAVVLHGTDEQTLRRGPGHLEHTALPGEPGHVVIAGHRDSFFRPLRHVRVGDDVFLRTPHERIHYRVMSLRIVAADDMSVVAPTNEATLTLITCYPFWVLGSAPDRFIVRAARVMDIETHASPAATIDPGHTPEPTDREVTVPRTTARPEALVREAIEGFRVAYNARAASRNEGPRPRPLTFASCDVDIANDVAVVRCVAPLPAAPEDASIRRFSLRHTNRGWTIQSVTLE